MTVYQRTLDAFEGDVLCKSGTLVEWPDDRPDKPPAHYLKVDHPKDFDNSLNESGPIPGEDERLARERGEVIPPPEPVIPATNIPLPPSAEEPVQPSKPDVIPVDLKPKAPKAPV